MNLIVQQAWSIFCNLALYVFALLHIRAWLLVYTRPGGWTRSRAGQNAESAALTPYIFSFTRYLALAIE